ncbi:Gx transporter family protein [candidate division KSB1 bacterium]|nr:Gx transporter family protein [candidate division KSB1 bacterium]
MTNYAHSGKTPRLIQLALLIAFGSILFIFESYFPRPLPWLKPGLANIASLLALYWFGFIEAFLITIIRILIGNFFSGTFLGPAFLLSLGGGISAILAMGLVKYYTGNIFSMIGVSVIGAVFHTFSQFMLASWLIIENVGLLFFLPFMIFGAVMMGTLVGYLALQLDKKRMKIVSSQIDLK